LKSDGLLIERHQRVQAALMMITHTRPLRRIISCHDTPTFSTMYMPMPRQDLNVHHIGNINGVNGNPSSCDSTDPLQ